MSKNYLYPVQLGEPTGVNPPSGHVLNFHSADGRMHIKKSDGTVLDTLYTGGSNGRILVLSDDELMINSPMSVSGNDVLLDAGSDFTINDGGMLLMDDGSVTGASKVQWNSGNFIVHDAAADQMLLMQSDDGVMMRWEDTVGSDDVEIVVQSDGLEVHILNQANAKINFVDNNTVGGPWVGTLQNPALSADQTWTLPSSSGTLALSTDNIYGTNGTLSGNRTMTMAGNTLLMTGGTTIHSLTSGTETITSGTGSNPIGFGSFGHLNAITTTAGDFDHFDGSYRLSGNPVYEVQIYDNTTFVEKAGQYVNIIDFSGTDRPRAGIYYTGDGVNFTGIEANAFGTRILDQNPINRLSAINASDGVAVVSSVGGNGYIGTVDQTGLAAWLGVTDDQTLAGVLSTGNQALGNNMILDPAAAAGDGAAQNSPIFYLRGNYDSDSGAGVTSTDVDTSMYTEVTLPFGNLQSQFILSHDGAQAYRISKASAGGGSFDHLWEAAAGTNTMSGQIASDGTVDYSWDDGATISTGMSLVLNSPTPYIEVSESGGGSWVLQSVGVTVARTYDLQDASGTLAFLSDITANSIYTADNSLTGNRTLTGGGNSLNFTGLSSFTVNSANSGIQFVDTDAGAANSELTLTSTAGTILSFNDTDAGGGLQSIQMLGVTYGGFIVTDASQSKGMEYAADYSANYTARSIVDKAYVDGLIAGNNELSEILANGNTTGGTGIFFSTGDNLDMNGNTIQLSDESGDIQSISTSAGDIIINSDAYRLWVQTDSGMEVDHGIVIGSTANLAWTGTDVSTSRIQMGDHTNFVRWNDAAITGDLSALALTANRTWQLPDASGIIALTGSHDLQAVLDAGSTAAITSFMEVINTDEQIVLESIETGVSNTRLTLGPDEAVYEYVTLGAGGNTSSLFLNGAGFRLQTNQTGGNQSIASLQSPGNVFIIEDSLNSKGVEYLADYSANYTARSLVDKAYVDGLIAGNNELSEILANGNTTGGTNISISSGDSIQAATGGGYLNLRQGADSVVYLVNDGGGLTKDGIYFETNYFSAFTGGFGSYIQIDDTSGGGNNQLDILGSDNVVIQAGTGTLSIKAGGVGEISLVTPAANQTATFQNSSGTIAYLSDITAATTLSAVLANGNTTGGTSINGAGNGVLIEDTVEGSTFTVIDEIIGVSAVGTSFTTGADFTVNSAAAITLDTTTGTGATAAGANIILNTGTAGRFAIPSNADPDTNITTPIDGVISYDTTDDEFRVYVNGGWDSLALASDIAANNELSEILLNGNTAGGTDIILNALDVSVDGGLNNSPDLILRATYDSDPTAAVVSADYDAALRHVMSTGGATPSSTLNISVGGTVSMRLQSDGDIGFGVAPTDAKFQFQGNAIATNTMFLLENSAATDIMYVRDNGSLVMTGYNADIDAGDATKNHVWNVSSNITERSGGDGFNVYRFASTFSGSNSSNHYRTMYVTAPSGGVDPAFGRYAVYGDAFNVGNNAVGIYGRAGSASATQYGGWFEIIGNLGTSRNRGVNSVVSMGASATGTGSVQGGYFQTSTASVSNTGIFTAMEGFSSRSGAALGTGTNIGGEFSALGGATNMALRVQSGRGDIVFGTTSPAFNSYVTIRGTGNTSATRAMRVDNSSGLISLMVYDNRTVYSYGGYAAGTSAPDGQYGFYASGGAGHNQGFRAEVNDTGQDVYQFYGRTTTTNTGFDNIGMYLDITGGDNNWAIWTEDGNVTFGDATPTTTRNPRLQIQGNGADAATDNTLWKDSGGAQLMVLNDNGQVVIGTGTAESSAALEIESTTGVLLLSRLNDTQEGALTGVNGMMHYNSTDEVFKGYRNSNWRDFTNKYNETFTAVAGPDTFVVVHNLNTESVVVSVRDTVTGNQLGSTVTVTDADTVTITGNGVTGRDYEVTVIG